MSKKFENIVKDYKNQYKRIQELNRMLKPLTKEDVIQAGTFARKDGERVRTGTVSQKTETLALSLDNEFKKLKNLHDKEREEYEREIAYRLENIAIFERALNRLDEEIIDFAKDMMRGMPWMKLEEKYNVSRATVGNRRIRLLIELEKEYEQVCKEAARQLVI